MEVAHYGVPAAGSGEGLDEGGDAGGGAVGVGLRLGVADETVATRRRLPR